MYRKGQIGRIVMMMMMVKVVMMMMMMQSENRVAFAGEVYNRE